MLSTPPASSYTARSPGSQQVLETRCCQANRFSPQFWTKTCPFKRWRCELPSPNNPCTVSPAYRRFFTPNPFLMAHPPMHRNSLKPPLFLAPLPLKLTINSLQRSPISCKMFKARGEVIVDHFALIRDGLSQAVNQRSRHLRLQAVLKPMGWQGASVQGEPPLRILAYLKEILRTICLEWFESPTD